MPGYLSRSKSMRLLKGHRKDAQQPNAQESMPRPGASQTGIDRYQSATPVSRKERDVETPDIAIRPGTSGGTGERTLFHMKTSQVATFHSSNNLPSSMSPNSSEGIIGIALGSPTTGAHWTASPSQSTENMSASAHLNSSALSAVQPEAPKSKLGRWKSMFRKAAPVPQQPEKQAFYQLTTTITATRANRADSHHDEEQEPMKQSVVPLHDRSIGRTPSPPTFKTNIRASRTFTTPRSVPEPPRPRARAFTAGNLPANPRVSVVRSATAPFPSNVTADEPPAVPKLAVSKSAQEVPTLAGEKPLLDVSIPDIKLDRYSVMFGNLLQSGSDRSSLLVRRQGNSEKLKPLNKLSVKDQEQESPIDYRLQRRVTTPTMPSPSPRLSLFPSTNNSRATSPRSASVPRSRGLYRSKTEKSPLHQTFSRKELDSKKGQELFVQKTTASSNLKSQASQNLKVQQLAITPSSIHSFESDTDSVTIVVGQTAPGQLQKLHLDDREPEWEMLSKPATVTRSNTTSALNVTRKNSQRKQPHITKLSALSSHPSSAPLEVSSPLQRLQQMHSPPQSARPNPDTPKESGNSATTAMVGVARSVSVSRANSPRTLVRTGSVARSPQDRLVERQALTPTMVEVRNRKSQRVQLVDA